MNYTEKDIPYTRIIEHKHFEFNKNNKCTWISYDYPVEYDYKTTDPYYPVNDEENNKKYTLYKNLSNQEKTIMFGGRLAEYKYYDMDDVIDSALNFIEKII
jgi:UDP-galactopyranose mutase